MRFGWVRAAWALSLVLAVAACGRGDDPAADMDRRARAAEFFMAANAKAEGVHTTASGLQYRVLQSGPEGASPDINDLVRVDYEGALIDGTVFDSSFERGVPFVTSPEGLGSPLIPGWTEALMLMKPGDEWLIYVPPALGYGEAGGPPVIPGNAVLVFRLKMLDIAPTPGASPSMPQMIVPGMARG